MRKKSLGYLFLIFAVLAFVAAGFRAARGGERVEVTFWHAMDGPRGEALQALVDRFNATHPGIVVRAEFKGSKAPYANNYSVLIQDLLAALRGNDPPTMSQVYENWTAQFRGAGALIPLETFARGKDGYTPAELRDFVLPFLKSNEPGGELWTLPFNKSLFVLYYNADLFKQAGLEPPKTWDDFRRIAGRLTVRDPDGNVSRYGFADPPNVDLFGLVFYAFGGDYFKDKKADFNGIVGQTALDFIRQMSSDRIYLPDYDALRDFASGKAAMYIDTTAALPYLDRMARFHVGLASTPREVREVALFAGTNLAIYKRASAASRRAAWIFIKWLLRPENVAAWSIRTGYLPVRRSALDLASYRAYLRRDPRLRFAISRMGDAFTDPRVWAWESIRGFMDQGVEEAVSGKVGVKRALDEAANATNRLMAQ